MPSTDLNWVHTTVAIFLCEDFIFRLIHKNPKHFEVIYLLLKTIPKDHKVKDSF